MLILPDNSRYGAVIDNAATRTVAKSLNIKFMGTLGILVLAKKQELINAIDRQIQSFNKTSLSLFHDLIEMLKKQFNE